MSVAIFNQKEKICFLMVLANAVPFNLCCP